MIELKNISKTYYTDTGVSFRALSNVSVNFDEKGLVFILGKSGSGKSTLLNILGALDNYDSGEMWVGDKLTKNMNSDMLDYYRNTIVGFVFQEFNLIESLSVMENVGFALDIKTEKVDFDKKERVLQMLDKMGIKDKAYEKARNLSGGQRQRVAIARALIKEPQIILADEPTGSLDSVTGQEIIEILREIADTKLVIVVTHDIFTAAKYGDRIIELKDGKIYRDVKRRKPGESIMATGIDIVSNTIVRLNKDTEIDEYFTSRINEIISDSGRKTFLNVDTDENKMKALFPNLRDAVKIERELKKTPPANGENGENGVAEVITQDDFIPYTGTAAERKNVEFKRSKIAFKSAFKMGVHNLKLKKFRLVLIIIVTCIAFTLFGAMNTLSETEMARALATTIEHDGIKTISVSKNYTYYSDGSGTITDDLINEFKEKYPKYNFYKQHFLDLGVSPYNQSQAQFAGYVFYGFKGITEIDDVKNLGFTTIGGQTEPLTDREVIISSYAAGALIKGGTFGNTYLSPEAIIGSRLLIDGFEVTIADIIDSDLKAFAEIDESTITDAFSNVFQLFVQKDSGFLRDYLDLVNSHKNVYINTDIGGNKNTLFSSSQFVVGRISNEFVERFWGNKVDLLENDTRNREGIYLVFSGDFSDYMSAINAFNSSLNSHITIGHNADYSLQYPGSPDVDEYISPGPGSQSLVSDLIMTLSSSDYYIKGYINVSQNIGGVALSESTYENYLDNFTKTKSLMIGVSGGGNENISLLRDLIDNDMQVNAYYSYLYVLYLGIFLNFKGIITGAVIFLSVLACLLTYNFISTSIRLTKRNIGLMRALGVKKLHTFFVYVMEGLTVAGITFIVSLTVLMLVIPIINAAVSATVGFYLPIMLIVPPVFLRMAALSLGVSVLATFVPWFKFAKITPVEAISSRTNEK